MIRIFYLRQGAFLASSMLRMLVKDPRAFLNKVVERLRQDKIVSNRIACALSRDDQSRSFSKIEEHIQLGELSAALEDYNALGKLRRLRYSTRISNVKDRLRQLQSQPFTVRRSPINNREIRSLVYLTNSLPFTKSGYSFRSQALMFELSKLLDLLIVETRLGFPLVVGRLLSSQSQVIDSVRYDRYIPFFYSGSKKTRQRQAVRRLTDVVQKNQINILHTTTNYQNALIVSEVASLNNIPWVYEVRGELEKTWLSKFSSVEVERAKNSDFYRLAREIELKCMKSANAVIALSEVSKQNLIERGVNADKIFISANAVEDGADYSAHSKLELRRELGLPSGRLFGSVTSVVPYEGLDLAVRALPELPDEYVLLVVGDGTELPVLQNLAKTLQVDDRALFVGKKENSEIWKWYATLDVFIVPRKDTEVCRTVTPLKPILAQKLGVPVVASDLPALHEVVGPGGIFFPPTDVSKFVNAVIFATDNEQLSAKGQSWAKNRTWSQSAKALVEAYKYAQSSEQS